MDQFPGRRKVGSNWPKVLGLDLGVGPSMPVGTGWVLKAMERKCEVLLGQMICQSKGQSADSNFEIKNVTQTER